MEDNKNVDEVEIGRVTHFYDKASVAVIELRNDTLCIGDSIHIIGHLTDLKQTVDSMQIEHKNVDLAEAGQEVAVKISGKCHRNDKVFKIIRELELVDS